MCSRISFRFISILFMIVFVLSTSLMLTSCEKAEEDPLANAGKKVAVYDDNNQITGYEIRSYNSDGLLSRLDVYDKDDVYTYFKTFEYDDEGRLIQETWYESNGLGDYYYTYKYDDDDNVIEKGYYPAEGTIEIICYDSKGNETDKYEYDEKDQLKFHYKYEDGKWVKYDADDNLINE